MQKLDPIKMIDTMLNYSEVVPAILENASKALEYHEGNCNDIEHHIELNELSDAELLEYSKQLRDSKRIRRECKNAIELLSPLCDLIKKNPGFFNSLKKVRVEVAKTKEKQERRRYYVRAREDLRPFFEKDKRIEYDTGENDHSESEHETDVPARLLNRGDLDEME